MTVEKKQREASRQEGACAEVTGAAPPSRQSRRCDQSLFDLAVDSTIFYGVLDSVFLHSLDVSVFRSFGTKCVFRDCVYRNGFVPENAEQRDIKTKTVFLRCGIVRRSCFRRESRVLTCSNVCYILYHTIAAALYRYFQCVIYRVFRVLMIYAFVRAVRTMCFSFKYDSCMSHVLRTDTRMYIQI